MASESSAASAAVSGATDPPSPVTSVVTPCVIFDKTRLSISTLISDWPIMSMKPGATTSPPTSTVSRACISGTTPTAAILSPLSATAPR